MEFAFILHAHLPYVRPRGPETLEERWLYEAVAETYIPLLWALENLRNDQIPARLSISLSPPLLAMLGDRGLMQRCRAHLEKVTKLAQRQAKRHSGGPLEQAATYHAARFSALVADLDHRGGDLPGAFRDLESAGLVELFTAAGTHGYLPLLASDTGRVAQIEAGLQEFEHHIGHRPAGLWLPECAYSPGQDHLLSAAGLRWFIAESSTVAAAWPPVPGAPCVRTPGGVAAFARDREAARLVWDSSLGYPGDPDYREFYRDEGFDLPLGEVAAWLVEKRVRSDTGLKYYRVTGRVPLHEKLAYNPDWARNKARDHARHFAHQLRQGTGLVVTPFDAELFGHWWFEGPLWIEALFRELAELQAFVTPVTPSEHLRNHPEPPLVRLPAGSWGVNGDHGIWLAPANDYLWPKLHAAELKMLELAQDPTISADTVSRAARQLLLAQSSDWPFILSGGTTVEYAKRRAEEHLAQFHALVDGTADVAAAQEALFSNIDGRALFTSPRRELPTPGRPLRVLMLSWEFPPANVGGLGRHVFDLGEAMAKAGHTMHIITLADDTAGPGSVREAGMVVHRIPRPKEAGNFLVWVYQYNIDMVAEAIRVAQVYGDFDVIHCHDWLVGQAGMALQARWRAPLVATIHATEKGRNGVIRTAIQDAIHAEEWQLIASANLVVTVSQAMAAEVANSFQVQPQVIYNGVKIPAPAGAPPLALGAPYFFYIGRLVVEKGVQVAVHAMAQLKTPAHLIVAGKGPMEAELKELAQECGIGDRVHFVGRVSDTDKGAWLQNAAGGLVPSLYEPFGITALEVMSSGSPVVVGDTGGLAEIVTHNHDGLKVPPGSVEALTHALELLLNDPVLARSLGAAGRETAARRFAWPEIASETLSVYERAVATNARIRR